MRAERASDALRQELREAPWRYRVKQDGELPFKSFGVPSLMPPATSAPTIEQRERMLGVRPRWPPQRVLDEVVQEESSTTEEGFAPPLGRQRKEELDVHLTLRRGLHARWSSRSVGLRPSRSAWRCTGL